MKTLIVFFSLMMVSALSSQASDLRNDRGRLRLTMDCSFKNAQSNSKFKQVKLTLNPQKTAYDIQQVDNENHTYGPILMTAALTSDARNTILESTYQTEDTVLTVCSEWGRGYSFPLLILQKDQSPNPMMCLKCANTVF